MLLVVRKRQPLELTVGQVVRQKQPRRQPVGYNSQTQVPGSQGYLPPDPRRVGLRDGRFLELLSSAEPLQVFSFFIFLPRLFGFYSRLIRVFFIRFGFLRW